MTIVKNNYYLTALENILSHVKISRGGKRYWDNNGNWWKDESTYPDYIRFFFKNKKDMRYDDEFFNGNRRELLRLLNKAKSGRLPKSKRLQKAFQIIMNGYLIEMEDIERLEAEYYG